MMATYQETWVFPCNVRFFNIFDHLATSKTVVWKKRGSVHTGDVVYIYLGSPYKEIRFKCHVIDEDVPEEIVQKNVYAIPNNASGKLHFVELELDQSFDEGKYPYELLKENDLGQVQIPARDSRRLRSFLERGED